MHSLQPITARDSPQVSEGKSELLLPTGSPLQLTFSMSSSSSSSSTRPRMLFTAFFDSFS